MSRKEPRYLFICPEEEENPEEEEEEEEAEEEPAEEFGFGFADESDV